MWPPSGSPARSAGSMLTCGAGLQPAEGRALESLGHGMEDDPAVVDRLDREADARDRHRAADLDTGRGQRRLDDEPHAVAIPVDRGDATDLTHDPREHRTQATVGSGLVDVRLEQHVLADGAATEPRERHRLQQVAEHTRPTAGDRRRDEEQELVDDALRRGTQWRASALLRAAATARLRRRAPRAPLRSGPLRSSSSEPAGERPTAEGEAPWLPDDGHVARVEPRLVGAYRPHPDRDRVGRSPELVHDADGTPHLSPSGHPGR